MQFLTLPSRLPARSALLLRRGVHRTPAPLQGEANEELRTAFPAGVACGDDTSSGFAVLNHLPLGGEGKEEILRREMRFFVFGSEWEVRY